MSVLQANKSIEQIRLLNTRRMKGEWDYNIVVPNPTKKILSQILKQFISCFDWIGIEKAYIVLEENSQLDNKWESTMDLPFVVWYDQLQYTPESFEYDLAYIELSAMVKCNSKTGEKLCKLDNFGILSVYFEKGRLNIGFSAQYNLFTKTAWIDFDSSKTKAEHLLDIGVLCRKQNREVLQNSLYCLGEKIESHVSHFHSEQMIPYINSQGFSDDCENEVITIAE